MSAGIQIKFEQGTLVIDGMDEGLSQSLPYVEWDDRTIQHRARGNNYRELMSALIAAKVDYRDLARDYQDLQLSLKEPLIPRPHQSAAHEAWVRHKGIGTVCLPTGAGKTILAVMIIAGTKRTTLVVVPTIDLMQQWEAVLSKFFGEKIGMLGGGYHELASITVATYDSAQMHMERLGAKFGLLIFDECHHLPGPQYQMIAYAAIAPYRLGLSATLQRTDGKEELIYELVGPLVYEGNISSMIGTTLSPYDVITCEVPMTEDEYEKYLTARELYTSFLRQNRISMSQPGGWQQFIYTAMQSKWGREAFHAYREQKQLSQASQSKLDKLWEIIGKHKSERMIVFTNDNDLAYRIGRMFFLPVLTHQTKIKERKKMLAEFKTGNISILVTSKVLNEGVDVPEASVAVVVSGSGTVREHVQRLGRILRSQEGKKAILYELVSEGTSEFYVNLRRREHHAYQRSTDS